MTPEMLVQASRLSGSMASKPLPWHQFVKRAFISGKRMLWLAAVTRSQFSPGQPDTPDRRPTRGTGRSRSGPCSSVPTST